MISKIIVVLATVCVINASVLTVNVFDDDPGTELASSPKDCNFRACDQLCRRLKFPGGACVNGRCKCDKFLHAEDGVSEKSLSNVENPVSLQDETESELAASQGRCNRKACDLVCSWLYKKRGSCVNGRCNCAKSLVTADDTETEIENKKSDCNNQACDQLCRRLKFPGGACVNGRCKCDKFLNAEGDMNDPAEFFSPGGCNFRACDQKCFRFGYSGGTCVNGRCKCSRYLNAEDTIIDSAEYLQLSSCNSIACDDKCRRTGWSSGVCIKGQCKCDYFLNTEDAVDEYSDFPIRVCRLKKCSRKCTRRGYEVAKCVNGRCKCYNKTQEKDADSPLNDVTSDENDESNVILGTYEEEPIVPSSRACNTVTCNQMCHRLNYAGGWCRFGQCQCY